MKVNCASPPSSPNRAMPLHQICVTPVDNKPATDHKDGLIKDVDIRRDSSGTGGPNSNEFGEHERCPSQTSTISMGKDICRICHCESDSIQPLIAPCYCSGSLRFVHQSCLQQWIKSSDIRCCELCKFEFIMETKVKPLRKWEKLEMTSVERRKITCSITFHVVALTCVVWSLYVLIHRTAEEMEVGNLEWPFWTKLIVVAVGFSGGLIFMYVQCKIYTKLCKRWRAYNRVIYVQNVPEKGAVILNLLATTSVATENAMERANPLSAKSLASNTSNMPRRYRTQSAPNIIIPQSGQSEDNTTIAVNSALAHNSESGNILFDHRSHSHKQHSHLMQII